MSRQFRRIITLIVVFVLSAWMLVRCVPEKEVTFATKITTVRWLDEADLLVGVAQDHFIRKPDGTMIPSRFDTGLAQRALPFRLEPPRPGMIVSKEVKQSDRFASTLRYVEIDGAAYRLDDQWVGKRQSGINQGFPEGNYLPTKVYLQQGELGVITFRQGAAHKTELPLLDAHNQSAPVILRDQITNQFFAVQRRCRSDDAKGVCTRTGWWLDADFAVTSSFLMPVDDPLATGEKLACFSCGCECFTQEDFYAVGGRVFVHVSGFPIKTRRRGLYEVVLQQNRATWRHVIKGRIEPPLAFSPSGCRVASFRVSHFGDGLETWDLCP